MAAEPIIKAYHLIIEYPTSNSGFFNEAKTKSIAILFAITSLGLLKYGSVMYAPKININADATKIIYNGFSVLKMNEKSPL